MTEEEYVHCIMDAIDEYLAFLRGDIDDSTKARKSMDRWDHLKTSLSPHTMLSLCEAWLATKSAPG